MCLTATIGEYLGKLVRREHKAPAFDALYGVCSYADHKLK